MRSYAFLLIFALISIKAYTFSDSDEIKCTHDHIEHNHEILDIEEDLTFPEGRALASYPNMKLKAHFDFLSPTTYKSYFENELIPPILDYFSAALRVKYPSKSRITITRGTICSKNTPSVLKSGVDADYYHIFDSTTDSGSSWVAESTACNLASGTRRPLVGKTLLNRALLKDANGDILMHEKNTYLVLHEMIHTLGFSSSLYNDWLDDNGKTRKGHVSSIRINGKTNKVINVPSLTNRLRNYFGCSSLDGAYLENDGSSATAGSHFERKFFMYEAMTSGLIHGERISEFSLAMLEASGWYEANYDYAEPFYFGQGQGCSFLTKKCSGSPSFDEFCSGSSRGCAPHGRAGGRCSSDNKADGCKFYKPNQDYDCENPDAADNARLPNLQVFGRGAGSRCFTGTLSSGSSGSSSTSFCFKYTCQGSGSGTTLQVQVGSHSVTCTRAGTQKVLGYGGSIDCPDPLAYCQTVGKQFCPRGCMGRGTCENNKCVCNQGYKGVDCGLRA